MTITIFEGGATVRNSTTRSLEACRRRVLPGLLALCLVASATASTAADWNLDRNRDGIEVFTRPVENSGIKEFKGIAYFDATVDQIVAVLRDSDRFKTWFPNCPESKLLFREGDVSVQYSVMDAPWPVSDRDNVLRSVTYRNAESGSVKIVVQADPDFYPEQDERVRVQQAQGSWLIEPVDEVRTRVTFQMHLEPGGGIPDWLSNARVVETPFEALGNLRQTVSR